VQKDTKGQGESEPATATFVLGTIPDLSGEERPCWGLSNGEKERGGERAARSNEQDVGLKLTCR